MENYRRPSPVDKAHAVTLIMVESVAEGDPAKGIPYRPVIDFYTYSGEWVARDDRHLIEHYEKGE